MALPICRVAADPGSGLPANTRRAARDRALTAVVPLSGNAVPGAGEGVDAPVRRRFRVLAPGWRYGQNLGLFGTTIETTQDAVEYLHNPESSSDAKGRIILYGIGRSVTFYERIHEKILLGPEFPKRKPYNL